MTCRSCTSYHWSLARKWTKPRYEPLPEVGSEAKKAKEVRLQATSTWLWGHAMWEEGGRQEARRRRQEGRMVVEDWRAHGGGWARRGEERLQEWRANGPRDPLK